MNKDSVVSALPFILSFLIGTTFGLWQENKWAALWMYGATFIFFILIEVLAQ